MILLILQKDFAPDREETMTLDNESRSKLNKDYVKPYDYTKQNSLYEIFKAPSLEYLYQLERGKEVRNTMWRKPFVRTKPNIAKNVAFLPVSESISKSRQVFNDMTFNINQFIEIVDQTWRKHTSSCFRVPTAHDMELLIKTLLMPLSIKSQNDSFRFEHELKTEMHEDFEYVKSLEKEIVQLILFIVDSRCTKHMTGNLKLLCNFVEKFLGTVHFGNDQFAPLLGYWRSEARNVTINGFITFERPQSQSFLVVNSLILIWRKKKELNIGLYSLETLNRMALSGKAEAVATASYTQNRSIIILTHGKMAYHLINDRKPLIKHLYIFGCICYITRDRENLDKMKEKGDPCIMVGYSTQLKGYRVYNKRTRLIVESIHIKFDEIKEMMFDHNSLDLAPQRQKMSVENVHQALLVLRTQ
ncbi:retrovirus-related pol polyprotein from transposon TNT 1-94 [Tanacetum coccineum]